MLSLCFPQFLNFFEKFLFVFKCCFYKTFN